MSIVSSYKVGTFNIIIVKEESGDYKYIATNSVDKPYSNVLKEELGKVLISAKESNMYSYVKNAAAVIKRKLRLNPNELKIAYTLREEMKYKKLQVLIDDPYIEDISISGPGFVWVRHSLIVKSDPDVDYIKTNIVIEDMNDFLEHLSVLAQRAGKLITKASPIVDANLPAEDGGHRIHLVLPDIADSKGEITIRKKLKTYVSLKDLINDGMVKEAVVQLVNYVLRNRGSVIIVGPPGSGKTTLLKALLYELIPKNWKVCIIEDTPEIDIPNDSSWVKYVVPTSPWNLESPIDQFFLTKAALRSSVNRFIVIGETRGAEARVLVQAINMGLGSLTTFHGGSAEEALLRLMSPPISLTPYQVSMFDLIITLNYVKGVGLKRAVVSVDEPIYSISEDVVKLNNLYEYGEDVSFEEILSKAKKAGKSHLEITQRFTRLVQHEVIN
ncbi:MAG: hypothetical protein B7O98_02025 [Zestosphaera tikiterensis]|uniref:AAA+ ATPase domain-containing protein n=1 Tax=Zestosphaera tikiterensis TaxID=1973259 RepID=A0A2R7Y6R7_9CREN|nr:MAG: hypothetical protein B7O98_02025 [Zestosphaera tikiterensis]